VNTTALDTTAMIGRSLRVTSRKVDSLLLSIILPVVLMLLFVYVFGGAINTGTAYVNYVVPGILVLCAGYGASQTGVVVCEDVVGRLVDRFRTMPIRASAVLTGHVVASAARNAVSTVLVLGMALLLGFRPDATASEWFVAGGLVLLLVLALSWVSACLGLIARSAEAAGGLGFAILFLPYISSAFVPTATMPPALRAVADHQPITPTIETLRGLLTGTPIGANAGLAVAWWGTIAVAACVTARYLFARRAAA
jgi:ABC-2 type transport system permease protein